MQNKKIQAHPTARASDAKQSGNSALARGRAAILVEDHTARRLLEGLALQLELDALSSNFDHANDGLPDADALAACELILADEAIAGRVRSLLERGERYHEAATPAVIAVRQKGTGESVAASPVHGPEATLMLPEDPAILLAQLSVALYAYRAFMRRHQSALDELSLNRRIFRSVTNGISISDATLPDLPLVYVNPAFERMTGYSLEEVQGKNCRFLQRDDRDQAGLTQIRKALAAGTETTAVLKNYRKDGTSFWNELSLSPIRGRDGKVTHVVGIQTDVTARVEFEDALRESEKLAAVGRLAASIAHEINNPLESLTNLIYLARLAGGEEDRRNYLEQADQELQRVSQITSQSLRFYRQSTKPMAVGASDMLEPVLKLYEAKLEKAKVRLERRDCSKQLLLVLESEIRQVLHNLVRNALEAMMEQGGRLLVRTREATHWPTGKSGATMTIADTGSGIPPEVMRNLYTAFYTTKPVGGTGLGLWVSAEIVNRHEGSLRVRSSTEPGKSWTVFQLFLPCKGLSQSTEGNARDQNFSAARTAA